MPVPGHDHDRLPTGNSQSFACRWDWCRATFSEHKSLVEHVVDDHIKTAKPVKRKDVPLIRRAEEGASGLTDSLLATQSQSQPQPSSPVQIHPSAYHSPAPTPPPTTPPPRLGPTHRAAKSSFTSYAAQSSPMATPSMPSLPPSPALNHLVTNAINAFGSRTQASRATPTPSGSGPNQTRADSQEAMEMLSNMIQNSVREGMEAYAERSQSHTPTAFPSATSSQDIESQLTQDREDHQSPSRQEPGHASHSISSNPNPAPSTTLSSSYQPRTQAWYQSHHPSLSQSQTQASQHSTPSPSHGASQQHLHRTPARLHAHVPNQAHSHPHHPFSPFRSSSVRIPSRPGSSHSAETESQSQSRNGAPVLAHADRATTNENQTASESSQVQSQSQLHRMSFTGDRVGDQGGEMDTQGSSGADSAYSLPLQFQLQTQAPYLSQSDSQSFDEDRR